MAPKSMRPFPPSWRVEQIETFCEAAELIRYVPLTDITRRHRATAVVRSNTAITEAMARDLLLHLAWRTKNTTFSFSNQMLRRYYRVSPQTKRRALEELEAAGQISIERQRGRAPIITLIGF
jgi:hypothetical protein